MNNIPRRRRSAPQAKPLGLMNLPSNWQCHRQLFKIVWGTDCCPDCGGKLLFRPNYEWCKRCRLKTSVKSETHFRNSNLSYRRIYALIWCWQQKVPVGQIRNLTHLSYPTVSKWLNKLRSLLPELQLKLSGLVEVDETYVGRMKFTKSGGFRLVVGAIERDTRRVKLRIVPDRSRESLESFILDSVATGSHINTDAWYAYNELHLLGYTHDFCNHSIGHFGETNLIENLWSVIKRHIRTVYGKLARINLPLILKEWEIRQGQPKLMYNVTNYLERCACSGLFE